MRGLIFAAGLLALVATSARAGTIQEVIAHGIVVKVGDGEFDLTFTPDGKFADKTGQVTGTWRIDGDKLCTTAGDGMENCSVYPADKKSGDSFDVVTPQVTVTMKIK